MSRLSYKVLEGLGHILEGNLRGFL